MILFSSHKAEQALAEGSLQPWEKVKYLILPMVLANLSGPFYIISPLYGPRIPTLNSFVSMICGLLSAYLTYLGIKWCFQANQQIDGQAFLERFVVLVVPPFIKVLIMIFLLSVGLTWSMYVSQEQFPSFFKRVSIITALFGPTVTYILFLMVKNSFLRLGKLIYNKEPSGS